MICERCGSETVIHTMSWFNKQTICMTCDEEEIKHHEIRKAKDADNEELKKGNFNFNGIGLPVDLQEKYNCDAFGIAKSAI